MPMITCPDCSKEISDIAPACPNCGRPQLAPVLTPPPPPIIPPKRTIGILLGIGILFIPIIFTWFTLRKGYSTNAKAISFTWLILCLFIFSNFDESKKSTTAGNVTNPVTMSAPPDSDTTSSPAPMISNSQWSYSQFADEMSKGTRYIALVSSSNTVDFDFPYSGEQHATLKLRIDPDNAKDVIFSIEKGQILCPSYGSCTVLVRFDDGKASNYTAVGTADNSTETIFINNYSRFVENMLKAKRVRISTTIFQQGAPVFEFEVSGFDQNKFKPKN